MSQIIKCIRILMHEANYQIIRLRSSNYQMHYAQILMHVTNYQMHLAQIIMHEPIKCIRVRSN